MTDFLKSKGLQTRFRLIIIGIEDVGLSKLVKKFRLESNVRLAGPLSYTDTLNCCMESDVLLVLEAPYEEGIYLPSKFVDYVQTGRPILAISPKIGTVKDILSEHGGGIAVDCTSAREIENALNDLCCHWEKNTLDDVYSSDRLYPLFAPENIISSYTKIFEHIGLVAITSS